MRRDRGFWAHQTVVHYDIACALACRIATLEGLEPRSPAWAARAAQVYNEELERLHPNERVITA